VEHNLQRHLYAKVTNLCTSHIHGPRYLNTMLLITHSQLPPTSPLHLLVEVPTKTSRKPITCYGSLDTTSPLHIPDEVPTETSRKPNTCYDSLDTISPLHFPDEVPTKTSRKPNKCYGSDTTTKEEPNLQRDPYAPVTNL
jgi:hypothetical protein